MPVNDEMPGRETGLTEPVPAGIPANLLDPPAYCGPALLFTGDAVATTRDTGRNEWEPCTFLGYVTSHPVKNWETGMYIVMIGDIRFEFRPTQTLAVWMA